MTVHITLGSNNYMLQSCRDFIAGLTRVMLPWGSITTHFDPGRDLMAGLTRVNNDACRSRRFSVYYCIFNQRVI